MKQPEFDDLRKRASQLYSAQGKSEKDKVSLDAIFSALALGNSIAALQPRRKNRKTTEGPAPAWFTETLKLLKEKGEKKVTVARFLMYAGRVPVQRGDQLIVGQFLRGAGYEPIKTGGNFLYDLTK